ncbi:MAG: hypothetical protein JWO91_1411 [Acidobacteriaceae bacterium]|nr:hypothetical protein [Acidobacteriaceae bacterium]
MAAPRLVRIETRTTVECRICGSPHFVEYLEGRGFRIVECVDCGLRYVNPQPTNRELREFYAGFDLENTWRGDEEERFDRAMWDFVLGFRRSGSILDVGSSRARPMGSITIPERLKSS